MNKFATVIMAAAAATLLVTGCSKGDSSKIKVGFSQVGAESDWRKASTESIKGEANKRENIELTFSDAQQKQENQIKAIRNFISKGVDVISFSPVVATGFEDVLKEAKEAEIPVVLFAHNDDMALGAIQAIEEAGKKPGKDIIIISIDGVKTMFEQILAGKANCTVECNPLIGAQLFDVVEQIHAGKSVPLRIPSVEGVYDNVGDINVGTDREPVVTKKITQEIVDSRKY